MNTFRSNHNSGMRRRARQLVLALGITLFTLSLGPAPSHAAPAPPENFKLAVSHSLGIFAQDEMAAFGVVESWQGEDLNGDGDQDDTILHVYNGAGNGQVVNTRYYIYPAARRPMCLDGDHLAFIAYEDNNKDFNDDGDGIDNALVIWNIATNSDSVHPQAAGGGVACGGGRVTFRTSEAGDQRDYNGDGDAIDSVWHVYTIATALEHNLELAPIAAIHSSAKMNDEALIFTAWEPFNSRDLNDDGDQDDIVFFTFDFSTGLTHRYLLAGYMPSDEQRHDTRPPGRFVPMHVPESWQGNGQDLNFDGDTDDIVVFAIDSRQGNLIETDLAGFGLRSSSRWLTLFVDEEAQGNTDINGDGDTDDTILVFKHAFSGLSRNTRKAVTGSATVGPRLSSDFGSGFSSRKVAAEISEADSNLDLDGDGQMNSHVVMLFDPRFNTEVNMEARSKCEFELEETLVVGRNHALTCIRESDAPATDMNGDGDTSDWIPGAAVLGSTNNVHSDVALDRLDPMFTLGENGYFLSRESDQGQDLNNDGDLFDRVLHMYDLDSGRSWNHEMSVSTVGPGDTKIAWAVNDERVFFAASEPRDGQDYNGDGDTSDAVLHMVK